MKVVVLGASNNPSRFSYKAMKMLIEYGHDAIPVGIKKEEIFGKDIINSHDGIKDVDTLALYVSPRNQAAWFDFIINTKPRRIICNPGTENTVLYNKAYEHGIEIVEDCTLVMLATNTF